MYKKNNVYQSAARISSLKRISKNNGNKSRWLISYADIITLLFVFFVVLYGISSLNDDEYNVMAEAISNKINNTTKTNTSISNIKNVKVETNKLSTVKNVLNLDLKDLVNEEMLKISQSSSWLRIELEHNLKFKEASSAISDDSYVLLKELASTLNKFDNSILVEGYTDDKVLSSNDFASNWELSAARAASVARALNIYGISKNRLAAIGYGPSHPIADNLTIDGREKNRRVSILINKIEMHEKLI